MLASSVLKQAFVNTCVYVCILFAKGNNEKYTSLLKSSNDEYTVISTTTPQMAGIV